MSNEKSYILLFNLNERSDLQDSLNQLIHQKDVKEIKVWQDNLGNWSAFVRYSEIIEGK